MLVSLNTKYVGPVERVVITSMTARKDGLNVLMFIILNIKVEATEKCPGTLKPGSALLVCHGQTRNITMFKIMGMNTILNQNTILYTILNLGKQSLPGFENTNLFLQAGVGLKSNVSWFSSSHFRNITEVELPLVIIAKEG